VNKDKVLEIATKMVEEDLGITPEDSDYVEFHRHGFNLFCERFATAIEAATREECARTVLDMWTNSRGANGASALAAFNAIRNMGKEG
jgi:hypothetical protein